MGDTETLEEGEVGLGMGGDRVIPIPELGLAGVGVGAFTCRTGEGDCWRPPATLATSDGGVGDFENFTTGIVRTARPSLNEI
ncbi:hypothetical protein CRUP_033904 [Coryphaenoides rupestris]|nr:hypothetical protein CRUP_033904 [Coryphaenoides rupestris]